MADRGYASVLVLALLFGSALLIGLAVDVARLLAEWRSVSHDAHVAAETAAGWVVPGELYHGRLLVDGPRAHTAARDSVEPSRTVDTQIQPTEVCVAVGSVVEPGISRLVGATSQPIAATACASPRQG